MREMVAQFAMQEDDPRSQVRLFFRFGRGHMGQPEAAHGEPVVPSEPLCRQA